MILSLCISTFLASLLGSLHCAGMCGVFAAVATSSLRPSPAERLRLTVLYSGGRLASYIALGAVSGLAGQVLDIGAAASGFTNVAAIVAATVVTLAGLSHLAARAGARLPRVPVPGPLLRFVGAGHRLVGDWPPAARALAIGLLTTLLPCHWLYTFALTSAGTADPVAGAAVMAFFWLGTLPALVAAGATISRFAGRWQSFMPVATAALMVGTGVATIALRVVRPCSQPHSGSLVGTLLSTSCNGSSAQ
jgi:sulfite exporter TauE/SafE